MESQTKSDGKWTAFGGAFLAGFLAGGITNGPRYGVKMGTVLGASFMAARTPPRPLLCRPMPSTARTLPSRCHVATQR